MKFDMETRKPITTHRSSLECSTNPDLPLYMQPTQIAKDASPFKEAPVDRNG